MLIDPERKYICNTRVTGVSSCQHLIGAVVGNRIIVGNSVHSVFLGHCKECETWLIWLWGRGLEIKSM